MGVIAAMAWAVRRAAPLHAQSSQREAGPEWTVGGFGDSDPKLLKA